MKIAWLSRHSMTEEQKKELLIYCGEDAEIVPINITWDATEDANLDLRANSARWAELIREYRIIAGVFPPVALEAVPEEANHRVWTPVSKQDPSKRVGDGPIPFVHVRWAIVR